MVEKARGSEDGFDALVCCLEMVRYQGEFAGLQEDGGCGVEVGRDYWRGDYVAARGGVALLLA